jgi:hypothetical protein
MDTKSIGDSTTVVGRPSGYRIELEQSYTKPSNVGDTKHHRVGHNFVKATDYTEEEKPFFVKIGKDGLTAALHKLDTQLRSVRISADMYLFRFSLVNSSPGGARFCPKRLERSAGSDSKFSPILSGPHRLDRKRNHSRPIWCH